jgi:carboxynorspermidine decarboxylase
MPYRPTIVGAGAPGELAHTYRLGGLTCLAGDVIGDYSFAAPLQPGDRLVFTDMAHYSFVKTTMFNGVRHPALALEHANDALEIVRAFTYEDFKQRLS